MPSDNDESQDISGDNNNQIRSGKDTIAAIGKNSMAAGGDIYVTQQVGIPHEEHYKLKIKKEEFEKKISRLEKEVEALKLQQSKENMNKIASIMHEIENTDYTEKSLKDLILLGNTCMDLGEYKRASNYFHEILSKGHKEKSDYILGWGYERLGALSSTESKFDTARKYYAKIVSTDIQLKAQVDSQLGILEYRSGNYPKGVKLFKSSLEMFRILNSPQGIANNLNSLGNAMRDQNRFEEALQFFNESLSIKKDLNHIIGTLNTMHNIGILQRKLKMYNEALTTYHETLEIAKKEGFKQLIGDSNGSIGNVFLDMGDFDKAKFHYNQALKVHIELRNDIGIGLAKLNLGSLHLQKGERSKALALFYEAEDIFDLTNSEHIRDAREAIKKAKD